MTNNKLFTIITEEPARIEWCARKHCLIRTRTEDNITNTIYGIWYMQKNIVLAISIATLGKG